MKLRYSLLLLSLLLGALPVWAAPLETSFFSWEVPNGWTVSRDPSGQWEMTAPGRSPMVAVVSVGHLTTTPELYLKGSVAVWRSQGLVEPMTPLLTERENQAWFLVKHHPTPGEKPKVTIKWVRWRGAILVVTSFNMAQADMESWVPQIQKIGAHLRIKKPAFEEAALRAEVDATLEKNQDTEKTLVDLAQAKLDLNVARQDWEPFFAADKPMLYRAYIDYLEARYDATFAIVAGLEMGMGRDVVESRMQGLTNRRDELRKELHGF